MRRMTFFYLLLTLTVTFLCLSCSRKSDGTYTDVLASYEVLEKIEPTQFIDFTSPQSGDYLLRGWSYSERTHRWAEGRESQFILYGFQGGSTQKDAEMTIKCTPLIFPGSPEQSMKIYLNDRFLKKIILTPSWDVYRLSLPGKLLKTKNMITFKYAYAERPSDRLLDSKDKRRLSVAFRDIQFDYGIKWENANYQKGKNILIQYPASTINYYFKSHINSKICFQYKTEGDTRPYIEFMFDNGQTEKIDVSPHGSKLVYNLSKGNGRIAKMSLVVPFGDRQNRITWKSIKIYYPEEKNGNRKVEAIQSHQKTVPYNKKPDIFLYVVDALRSDHLSCYGYSRKTSPYLDKFAQENTLFFNAYANASWTKASAATLLTGLFPKKHKTIALESSLPPDLKTLPEILKANGYYTIAFITNDNAGKDFGFKQGFDEFYQTEKNNQRETKHIKSVGFNDYIIKFLDGFLNRKNRKPVFVFIWSVDPHDPYIPDKSVSHKFGIDQYAPVDHKAGLLKNLREGLLNPTDSQLQYIKALYDQEILFSDRSFESLLDKLKQKNIYENSIIIFTADHGEEFKEHGGYGHGMTLYNEVIKIPLVIKGKGIKKGVIKDNVQHTDLFPTLLDILNIKLPYKIDGKSLCKDEQLENRYIFAQEQLYLNDIYSIICDGYKLIYNISSHRPPLGKGVVPLCELYDLRADMEERHNLAESQPVQKGYLLQMLRAYINSKDDSIKVEEKKVVLTPELNKKLRELGYAK